MRSIVRAICISRIFYIRDLSSGQFRDLPMLTRAPLGYSAERAPLGGIFAPLPNSRTNRRSEAGEAAIDNLEREDSSAH